MVVGAIVSGAVTLAPGAELTIAPTFEEEWVIHNIYHSTMASLIVEENSARIVFDSDTERGAWVAHFFHVSTRHKIIVRNDSSTNNVVSFDGIKTKV